MSKNWYVLIVKPKHEIRVKDRLVEMNIEAYCPLIKELKTWSDRKKTIYTPLFKSYVFVCLNKKERKDVFAIPGILRYLFWLRKPAIVRDEEIKIIKKWLSDEKIEGVSLSKFTPGKELTIKHGVLKNKNVIIKEVGKERVRLAIKNLGIVINIELKNLL